MGEPPNSSSVRKGVDRYATVTAYYVRLEARYVGDPGSALPSTYRTGSRQPWKIKKTECIIGL